MQRSWRFRFYVSAVASCAKTMLKVEKNAICVISLWMALSYLMAFKIIIGATMAAEYNKDSEEFM